MRITLRTDALKDTAKNCLEFCSGAGLFGKFIRFFNIGEYLHVVAGESTGQGKVYSEMLGTASGHVDSSVDVEMFAKLTKTFTGENSTIGFEEGKIKLENQDFEVKLNTMVRTEQPLATFRDMTWTQIYEGSEELFSVLEPLIHVQEGTGADSSKVITVRTGKALSHNNVNCVVRKGIFQGVPDFTIQLPKRFVKLCRIVTGRYKIHQSGNWIKIEDELGRIIYLQREMYETNNRYFRAEELFPFERTISYNREALIAELLKLESTGRFDDSKHVKMTFNGRKLKLEHIYENCDAVIEIDVGSTEDERDEIRFRISLATLLAALRASDEETIQIKFQSPRENRCIGIVGPNLFEVIQIAEIAERTGDEEDGE